MNISAPSHLLPWLVYEQSLTEKLDAVAGDARLDVREQRWEAPDDWDRTVLKLNCASVMHREILMWAYDSPCWYARTILPDTTKQADTALFERLKNESLGQLLFTGNKVKRASLVHYMISANSPEYRWLDELMHQGESTLWMRLSEFKLPCDSPFFLAEVLLPGLSRYIS